MRRASYVPGELIPLPLSGSIPELPHVAKVETRATPKISRMSIFIGLRLAAFSIVFFGLLGGVVAFIILEPALIAVNHLVPNEGERRVR